VVLANFRPYALRVARSAKSGVWVVLGLVLNIKGLHSCKPLVFCSVSPAGRLVEAYLFKYVIFEGCLLVVIQRLIPDACTGHHVRFIYVVSCLCIASSFIFNMFPSYEQKCLDQLQFSPWTEDAKVDFTEVTFDDRGEPRLVEGHLGQVTIDAWLHKVCQMHSSERLLSISGHALANRSYCHWWLPTDVRNPARRSAMAVNRKSNTVDTDRLLDLTSFRF